MEKENIFSKERKTQTKDVTEEFLDKNPMEFLDFLDNISEEPTLIIKIKWSEDMTEQTLRRLKAFLEDFLTLGKQKRTAVVMATEEQKEGSILSKPDCRNAFASGVKWEEIEN